MCAREVSLDKRKSSGFQVENGHHDFCNGNTLKSYTGTITTNCAKALKNIYHQGLITIKIFVFPEKFKSYRHGQLV